MPPEIADSDDESEIILQGDISNQTTSATTRQDNTAPGGLPTQRLPEMTSSSVIASSRAGKFGADLSDAAPDDPSDHLRSSAMDSTGKSKRARSDIEEAHVQHDDAGPRRSRTYGSKTRDYGSDLFAETQSKNDQPDAGLVETENGLPTMPSNDMPAPATTPRERDRPRRVVSLLQQNMANPNHHVTTSMSSMGGYQSINLDFRGDGQGLDINSNPFGSISQISMEGESSYPTGGLKMSKQQLDDMFDQLAEPNIHSQMMSSPLRPGTPIRPQAEPLSQDEDLVGGLPHGDDTTLQLDVDEEDVVRHSKRRKTDTSSRAGASSPAIASRRAASVSGDIATTVIENSHPKKRGRKPKSKTIESEDSEPQSMAPPPIDQHHESRSQAGTLDLSSQTSHTSQSASNTKRKRKQSKPDKELKQHPSSELHLSDEQMIGLPKENYKPRPSRSRSKRLDEEDAITPAGATPDRELAFEATPSKADTPLPKTSTSKSKKAKVRRAKTSAGALLKKSEPMISEGEDDVVWMDTKPAAVKLDLPPNIKILKKEEDEAEESADELQSLVPSKRARVSVEIPVQPDDQTDGSSDRKAPKKRGRKPKKTTAALVREPAKSPPAFEEEQAVPPQTEPIPSPPKPDRRPLAPKDTNTTTPKSSTSPTKPPVNDITATQPPTLQHDLTTTKLPTQTPSPQKPTHSPLRPTSSSTSSRYRIGLSKRTKIPSLLRKVQRDKPPPTKVGVKVKELKVKGFNDIGDGDGGEGGDGEDGGSGAKWSGVLRDKEGKLVEWDF